MTTTTSNPFKLNILASTVGPWTPPYDVPTSPGEVVKIAGDEFPTANTITCQNGENSPSVYPTNVFADVRPSEVGGGFDANKMITGAESRTKFIESFSPAGAMVLAGTGGHHGTINFGACLFDLTDARWKRVWTTQGNPGVDNVTNEGPPPSQGGPPFVDVRSGTKIHNCLNYEDDLCDAYIYTPHVDDECWNSDHWSTGGSTGSQRAVCPIAADPRDQFWEVSRKEVLPYVAGTREHGWKFPGEWNGDQGGRFEYDGYVTDCLRFQPPVAGTLEPTQSELPGPAHNWDNFYELKPEEGGGPRGSIVVGRHANIGHTGVMGLLWSHRFDLHTGIWHKFSVNSSTQDGINPPTTSGGPHGQGGAMASAEDPVTRRVFMVAKALGSTTSINYMNLGDRTWRSFARGAGSESSPVGNTEQLFIDPDRRLLIITSDTSPHLRAIDLQTLTPADIPTTAVGGWKHIPYDDIPGLLSVQPFVSGAVAASSFTHGGGGRTMWRYYPPNGNFYGVNPRSMFDNVLPPNPTVTTIKRLTPPPIIATPRPNFYYTTEASSGRWTLDEITLNMQLPAPDEAHVYAVGAFSWFHYVPALECFVYAPCDFAGNTTVRRSVYLIKP